MPKRKPPSAAVVPTGVAAAELRTARKRAGLSTTELHRLTGISRTVLIGYEVGRTRPGEREIRLLCDALKVTPNKLIYGVDQPFGANDTLNRLGVDADALSAGHLVALYQWLTVEERAAVLTLIHAILEGRRGKAELARSTEAMKEFGRYLPELMEQIGTHVEKALTPEVIEEIKAGSKRRFARFEASPERSPKPKAK